VYFETVSKCSEKGCKSKKLRVMGMKRERYMLGLINPFTWRIGLGDFITTRTE
jgi:hypothetical protein